MDKFLILCAGEARRWKGHLGVPKQLVPVDGEPLVDRTIRMLRDAGASDVAVVAASTSFERPDTPLELVEPNVTGTVADKFLSSRHAWSSSGVTHILFGDVWFSETALQELLLPTARTRFLGRLKPGSFTGSKYPEIFAISVPASQIPILDSALTDLQTLGAERPGTVSGWSLYSNLLERQHSADAVSVAFVHVDDFTEDFDNPADFQNWLAARRDPASPFQTRKRYKTARRIRRTVGAGLLIGIGAILTLGVQAAL